MHLVTEVPFSRLIKCLFLFIATFLTISLFLEGPSISLKITVTDYYKSVKQPDQATWKVLIPSQLYVYSAFYALSEDGPTALFDIVKVTAIVNRKDRAIRASIKCRCVYANETVDAVLADLPEHHNESYTAAALTCNVNDVIMSSHQPMDLRCQMENRTGFVTFDMIPPPWMGPKPLSFAVCGPIIFGNGTEAEHIIEFVEYYKIMGASKFIFYLLYKSPAHSGIAKEVLMVLRYYEKMGLVTLMNWTIPEEIMNQVHFNGQLAALNECRLRVAGYWDYIIIADFDEFILTSLGAGFETIVQNGLLDCIVIRHAPVKFADHIRTISASKAVYEPRLTSHLQRDFLVWDVGNRSKYICRAQSVLVAGIHFPHTIRLDTRLMTEANPDETLVLHFREGLIEGGASLTEVDTDRIFGAIKLWKFTDNVNFVYDHVLKPGIGKLRRNITGS